jgi:hypothetical protein
MYKCVNGILALRKMKKKTFLFSFRFFCVDRVGLEDVVSLNRYIDSVIFHQSFLQK